MEIAIDTGNKQVKTDHSISISGVVPQNTIPATAPGRLYQIPGQILHVDQ